MKKTISMLLALCFLLSLLPMPTKAKQASTENEDIQNVYNTYKSLEHEIRTSLLASDCWYYMQTIRDIEKYKVMAIGVQLAASAIGEGVSPDVCVENLANHIALQETNILSQMERQSALDTTKKDLVREGAEFKDILEVSLAYIDADNILPDLAPAIDGLSGGFEVLLKSEKSEKYLQTIVKDYSQSTLFLNAIANNSEEQDMRTAAKALMGIPKELAQQRLDYLVQNASSHLDFGFKFFLKHMSYDLLKGSKHYAKNDLIRKFTEAGNKVLNSPDLALGKFIYKSAMFIGDTAFGTTNSFHRYTEMRLSVDLANSIIRELEKIHISDQDDPEEMIQKIYQKCQYYKILLSIHARGEYCCRELVQNEGGLFSDFARLSDLYESDQTKTLDGIFNAQIDMLAQTEEQIDSLLYLLEQPEGVPLSEDLVLKNFDSQGKSPYAFNSDILKSQVSAIEFRSSLQAAPEDALDVSETRSGRVLLWATPNGGGSMKLNIAGDGVVIFPENSRYLLGGRPVDHTQYENLKSIKFHDSVNTSRVKNMTGIFAYTPVETLNLKSFDTCSVVNMDDMFAGCCELKSLHLSSFVTDQVRSMNGMFFGCNNLLDIDLTGIHTDQVTGMDKMFAFCTSLKTLDLSHFNTSQVQSMELMFACMEELKDLNVSGFDTGNVSSMSEMFYACKSLKELDLNSFQTTDSTDLESMFEHVDVNMYLKATDARILAEYYGNPQEGNGDSQEIPEDAVEFNGHSYYLYHVSPVITWDEAKTFCEEKGGYLATITSAEEDEFLYRYMRKKGSKSAYFGMTDIEEKGQWKWVTGEAFGYDNWPDDQPDHQGTERYGMYFRDYEDIDEGLWNDGPAHCDTFLCEWGPYSVASNEDEQYWTDPGTACDDSNDEAESEHSDFQEDTHAEPGSTPDASEQKDAFSPLGQWAREGENEASYIFYPDGTCLWDGYDKHSWSLSNGNFITLIFAGGIFTSTIISCDSQEMTLTAFGEEVHLHRVGDIPTDGSAGHFEDRPGYGQNTDNSLESVIIGKWALPGSTEPRFAFYPDGNCIVEGSIETEWYLESGDMLCIPRYENGPVMRAQIISCDGETMEIIAYEGDSIDRGILIRCGDI